MIDPLLIQQKAASIRECFQKLEPLLQEPARAIIDDYLKLHTVERLFQLIVDTTIDINTHMIVESDFSVPDDYQSTFITLAEHKILPMEFALMIAPSVGLRNLVVHKYGKVDLKKMVDDIKNDVGQYLEYLRLIDHYLSSLGK